MDSVCRLCAKEKPAKQLVNSIEDETLNIPQKLIDCCRWNSIATAECATLPKKICSPCYRKLEMCWSFAENVSQVQGQINSMFAEKRPLLTSTKRDTNDTVVNKSNATDTSDEHEEPVVLVENLDSVLKPKDMNPSNNDGLASPNIEHDVATSNGRLTRKIRPAPERYQAGSSNEKEKGKKSKPSGSQNKARSSNAKETTQSKPMQKENQLKNVDAEKCGKQLPNHLRPSLQSFTCGTCGKKIIGDYQFKKHLNIHLDADGNLCVKPHKCGTCGKAFKKKDKLKVVQFFKINYLRSD